MNPTHYGILLETFIYNELRKQAQWYQEPLRFYHYRDKDKAEIDLIIEDAMGDCFAVEIKARATLQQADFKSLKHLQTSLGTRFKMGVLLYDGDLTSAFGDKLYAVPIGALWT